MEEDFKSMKKIHINNDDNYATPPKLYEELNKRFNFDFDPCPYNEDEIINDGLKIEWGGVILSTLLIRRS